MISIRFWGISLGYIKLNRESGTARNSMDNCPAPILSSFQIPGSLKSIGFAGLLAVS